MDDSEINDNEETQEMITSDLSSTILFHSNEDRINEERSESFAGQK